MATGSKLVIVESPTKAKKIDICSDSPIQIRQLKTLP